MDNVIDLSEELAVRSADRMIADCRAIREMLSKIERVLLRRN